jgi:threonyl-tRNA synthetase
MTTIAITLPDGSKRELPQGSTVHDVARSIGPGLEKAAVAGTVDGRLVDLSFRLEKPATVAIVTRESKVGLEILRHSTAHLLGHAVKELYPGTQITIGPVIEDGFYYDIDCPKQLSEADLPAIEAKMAEIAARKLDVKREVHSRESAIALFRSIGDFYKEEIIAGFAPDEEITAYRQGDFVDLCRGPHVPNTERLGPFKLLSVAGAYWRGDEKNKMLQRIYGTSFATKEALEKHLAQLEEAKKRDHRRLGPELGLFTFLPVAPAMPFYLPKGAVLLQTLLDYMRKELLSNGFQEVVCPQLMNSDLWKTSGHWDNYRDNMFVVEAEEHATTQFALKPMNCPGHMALFAATKRSYRELPIRFCEFTKLHRNERGGVTHGLLRTRAFCQDDGHLFCTPEQIETEAMREVEHTFAVYEKFGFRDLSLKIATKPPNALGSDDVWEKATQSLANSLNRLGKPFEWLPGEGAFYGPKIEFHIRDSIGRQWQCGTVQVDWNLPQRFQLGYVDADGTTKQPVVLHRAIFGSLERFLGILVEHYGGHLPYWLAPQQVVVINVTEAQKPYAEEVVRQLREWGVRAEGDLRNEKLGYKIREHQLAKIPVMLVVGNQEMDGKTVSVRLSNGTQENGLALAALKDYLQRLV